MRNEKNTKSNGEEVESSKRTYQCHEEDKCKLEEDERKHQSRRA